MVRVDAKAKTHEQTYIICGIALLCVNPALYLVVQ